MSDSVRLDVWLDIACLFKTRSEAQRECKLGRVTVNGHVAKAHRDVRVGDQLVIARAGGRKQNVVVRALADTHIAKAEARLLYEDQTPQPTPEEIERRRVERAFAAVARATRAKPDRRVRRDVAKRKWTT
jgi:ribosome-associated heat shock protein Hsp15